nr:hypothetical protein Iba_scaffold3996CG0010 [Ipomoea batatas]
MSSDQQFRPPASPFPSPAAVNSARGGNGNVRDSLGEEQRDSTEAPLFVIAAAATGYRRSLIPFSGEQRQRHGRLCSVKFLRLVGRSVRCERNGFPSLLVSGRWCMGYNDRRWVVAVSSPPRRSPRSSSSGISPSLFLVAMTAAGGGS